MMDGAPGSRCRRKLHHPICRRRVGEFDLFDRDQDSMHGRGVGDDGVEIGKVDGERRRARAFAGAFAVVLDEPFACERLKRQPAKPILEGGEDEFLGPREFAPDIIHVGDVEVDQMTERGLAPSWAQAVRGGAV